MNATAGNRHRVGTGAGAVSGAGAGAVSHKCIYRGGQSEI
jgi:hypothetical protein